MTEPAGPLPASAATAVYSSKRDLWLAILLWISVAIMLFGAWVVWQAPGTALYRLGLTAAFVLIAAFIVWILHGTRYELRGEELIIRSGPIRWRRSVHAIREVHPTRNPLSSPALSLDRLAIRIRGAHFPVMISPARREEFLADLLSRAPHLERRGDRLVERHAER
jgi:membrane protein YdbS with pleckstrin-like domain